MKAKIIGGSAAAVIAAAVALIAPWEGQELKPYRDIVGVLTVCYGETHGVEDRTYTPAECKAMLQSRVGQFYAGMQSCVRQELTQGQWVALTSWSYNVGVNAACKSTLMRRLNAGEPASAWCPELLKWNRAGGKVVRGLTDRRKAEYQVCIGE